MKSAPSRVRALLLNLSLPSPVQPPMSKPRLSTAHFPDGIRTELWRIFSYCVGDSHADRLCTLLDAYCFLFRVPPRSFWSWPGMRW